MRDGKSNDEALAACNMHLVMNGRKPIPPLLPSDAAQPCVNPKPANDDYLALIGALSAKVTVEATLDKLREYAPAIGNLSKLRIIDQYCAIFRIAYICGVLDGVVLCELAQAQGVSPLAMLTEQPEQSESEGV